MAEERPELLILEDDMEDRYSRLRLISWWDQDLLLKTKVLVIGAGALGNEILKNLALVGLGNILIVDMDRIESSNLSRSVLFRPEDEGKSKSKAAAEMVNRINPDCSVQWLDANVESDLGLGVYKWADLVIGGLDNREARVVINQSCWKVNTPWIDGAILDLFGVARVFIPPDSACYECTMNDLDRRQLKNKFPCRWKVVGGKVPTTPTISSIIAGIQVQEALKLIHNHEDMPVLAGKGLFFNGLNHDSYLVNYDRKEDCPGHEDYGDIKEIFLSVHDTTLGELLKTIHRECGNDAVIELEKELITELKCEKCDEVYRPYKILETLTREEVHCSQCGDLFSYEATHIINGSEPYLDLMLSDIGIPGMEVFSVRNGSSISYYELTKDREEVLGGLYEIEE